MSSSIAFVWLFDSAEPVTVSAGPLLGQNPGALHLRFVDPIEVPLEELADAAFATLSDWTHDAPGVRGYRLFTNPSPEHVHGRSGDPVLLATVIARWLSSRLESACRDPGEGGWVHGAAAGLDDLRDGSSPVLVTGSAQMCTDMHTGKATFEAVDAIDEKVNHLLEAIQKVAPRARPDRVLWMHAPGQRPELDEPGAITFREVASVEDVRTVVVEAFLACARARDRHARRDALYQRVLDLENHRRLEKRWVEGIQAARRRIEAWQERPRHAAHDLLHLATRCACTRCEDGSWLLDTADGLVRLRGSSSMDREVHRIEPPLRNVAVVTSDTDTITARCGDDRPDGTRLVRVDVARRVSEVHDCPEGISALDVSGPWGVGWGSRLVLWDFGAVLPTPVQLELRAGTAPVDVLAASVVSVGERAHVVLATPKWFVYVVADRGVAEIRLVHATQHCTALRGATAATISRTGEAWTIHVEAPGGTVNAWRASHEGFEELEAETKGPIPRAPGTSSCHGALEDDAVLCADADGVVWLGSTTASRDAWRRVDGVTARFGFRQPSHEPQHLRSRRLDLPTAESRHTDTRQQQREVPAPRPGGPQNRREFVRELAVRQREARGPATERLLQETRGLAADDRSVIRVVNSAFDRGDLHTPRVILELARTLDTAPEPPATPPNLEAVLRALAGEPAPWEKAIGQRVQQAQMQSAARALRPYESRTTTVLDLLGWAMEHDRADERADWIEDWPDGPFATCYREARSAWEDGR